MTVPLIMAAVCVAGVMFMLRFLVALFAGSKPKSTGRVVFLPSRSARTENDAFGLIPEAEFGGSGPHDQSRFQVIADGNARSTRKLG